MAESSFNSSMSVPNFSVISEKLIEELNVVRRFPASYSKRLQNLVPEFKGNNFTYKNVTIKTKEGLKALYDAISFLKSFKSSLDILTVKDGLKQAADDTLNLLILHDGIQMLNSNKGKYEVEKRVNKYGVAYGEINELVCFDVIIDPFITVLGIILSDDDTSRKQRNMLFSKKVKYTGVTVGSLTSNKFSSVVYLAEYYYDKNEFIPHSIFQKFSKIIPDLKEKESSKSKERIREKESVSPQKQENKDTNKPFSKAKIEKTSSSSSRKKPDLQIITEKAEIQNNPVIKLNIDPSPQASPIDYLSYSMTPQNVVPNQNLKLMGSLSKPSEISYSVSPMDPNIPKLTNMRPLNTNTLKPTEFEFTLKSFNIDNSIQPIADIARDHPHHEGSQIPKNLANFNFEEDFDELPEGVDRVEIREKPIVKGEKKFYVRKTIHFSNGVSETYYYQK